MRFPSTESVLTTGVCLEEILKFLNFCEIRKLGRVSKTFQETLVRTPQLNRTVDYVGFSLADPLAVAASLSRHCQVFRADVSCQQQVEEILPLLLRSNLRVIEIFHRRADGSVVLSSNRELRTSGLQVSLQFSLTQNIADCLLQSRITGLSVRQVEIPTNKLQQLIRGLAYLEQLQLGFVSDCDDALGEELLQHRALCGVEADDLNVSLNMLKRLAETGKMKIHPLLELLQI